MSAYFMRIACFFTFIISGLLLVSHPALGVILFGPLRNSDGSTPANADITFICYVRGSDNEIQTEDTVTQNYSNGFWSVETQNFTPNPPATGDTLDIFFTNVANGESAHFQTTVPSTATQYPLITLASSANPAVPTGVTATPGPPGTATLTWNAVGDLTYRIYRHVISGGAYDRIATGVAGTSYIDNSGLLIICYYVIVADDGTNISGHSSEVMADQSLPVELSAFTATVSKDNVTLHWRTESELNNLGFNVFRSDRPDGEYIKVNMTLIKGAGTDATPHEYQFFDEQVELGKTYYYYVEDVDLNGQRNKSHLISVTLGVLPTTWGTLKNALGQNYPNPFNPETWIPYRLAENANVILTIYDIRGQVIRTLDVGFKPAAVYESKSKAIYWDGRNEYGERVASGVYFYTLTANDFTATRKMLILK